MAHISEYEVENKFIDRLESIGYEYVELKEYRDVLDNLRAQLIKFNAAKLTEAKGSATLSDIEFDRVKRYLEGHTVYESAKILRDKLVLTLDNEKTVYLDFFSHDTDRNIYQVSHQIKMTKNSDYRVRQDNRYDVTVLINGLPLVQIELKRPGTEISEAVNQINRYRKCSLKGIFRYLQIFVVSNSVQTKYFCNENESVNEEFNPISKSLVFFWTDAENKRINTLEEFTADFFRKSALTEMIDKYMVIKSSEPVLMVMRPYQIYAVKAAKKRVIEANQNGYVFACTGSGKTLTSYKLAQLLREEPVIDKVIFLIDRKDLDDQTVDEYNNFEKGCVDTSDSTAVLVKQLKDADRKLIVTTIQKMANAVKSKRYEKLMDGYRDKKVVFIVDECHRSQYGKMHGDIAKHFCNANYIGFTGTPIFKENKTAGGMTTADVFSAGKLPNGEPRDSCLHRYMIKNAIADGNVLRFSVEFQSTFSASPYALDDIDANQIDNPVYCRQHNIDIDRIYHDDERIRYIVEDILKHHAQHTRPQGKDVYTALFAVDSIKTLGQYYDVFKELNGKRPEDKRYKIAAIFTYGANEDLDGVGDEHSAELLSRIIKDYNEMFGTSFSIDGYDAYRKDIVKRLKQKDLPQVDILIVVNMMLTGFDAKPLNTLYLDKNLVWHSLVQAYSRTNRVDKLTKQFGQIITYRNIKQWQDDALRLYSGDGDPNEYLLQSYEYYLNKWTEQVANLRKVVMTVDDAGRLENEDDIRMFILAFRALVGTLATLKTFSRFDWEELAESMDEEEYDGFKSWYLEYLRMQGKNPKVPIDVDFKVELVRTDRITVAYILNLLKNAHKEGKIRGLTDADLDLILSEIERSDNESLRVKKELIIEFVRTKFYEITDDIDLQAAFENFVNEKQKAEMAEFARANNIELSVLNDIMTEYAFNGKISNEDIRKKYAEYHLGIIKTTELTEKTKDFIKDSYFKYRAEGE